MHRGPCPYHHMCCCSLNKSKAIMHHTLLLQYIVLFLLIYFFAVKDGYNNLFAGKCIRHDRIYNTYGDGRWVSSLNYTLKLHSAIFVLFFFFKKKTLLIFLAAYHFRKNSGHCSCVSQIGIVGILTLQQTEV